MLELFFYPSPNCWKISIALEETETPYKIVPVNILEGRQTDPDFRMINPNGRVPAIRDPETGETRFESGAILLWLAEHTGRLLPEGPARLEAIEWLFWQMGGLGPMAGQAHHFLRYAPPGNGYSADRYQHECKRLYSVLDARLNGRAFLAGEMSVADVACWPWVWYHRMHGIDLCDFPDVARWFQCLGARDAFARGRRAGLDMLPGDVRPLFDRGQWEDPPDRMAEATRID
ncbi:MAG: glutathione S-transferase family protein [Thermaurantiacus sp.]